MSADIERIRDALRYVPVGGHDERVRVAFMLKSELGDEGRDLWDEWREGRGDDEAASVWRSASENGLLRIGSLFHEAKKNGWRDDGVRRRPSPEDLAKRQRIAKERAATSEAIFARERADAAACAASLLEAAEAARNDHPYLLRKQVSAVGTLREIDEDAVDRILRYRPRANGECLRGRLLVVPVWQNDDISTVELIDGDGRKAALLGRGTKAAGYWVTESLPGGNGLDSTFLIGEGVATVLSASAATGQIGMASLSSGNLKAVALWARERYPAATLVILADLIKDTGVPDCRAIEAAQLVGGMLAVPVFEGERPRDMTDFNDMAVMRGAESVASAIANAGVVPPDTVPLGRNQVEAGQREQGVSLLRASEVTPEPITWLWTDWLAAGKLHLLGGAPGTGKTTIGMGIAATVTTGGIWPDGTQSIAGNVVVWSGEDDPADTLIPRLALSGADLSRVYFISDVREGNERRAFDPASDMGPLQQKLAEIGEVRLLVVDPIVSAISKDSHKNAEVRRGLQPLVDLASRMRCALLGITHFSKGTGGRDPVERLTGSLAFGALARVVLVAAKYQEEGEKGRTVRLFCRAKSNIGPDDGGFEYDLCQAELDAHPGIFSSSVLWGEAVEGSARDLLASADASGDDGEGGSLVDAKRFLADLLADGALPTKTIRADADGAGYSWATIRRAQRALGVEAAKEGMKGGWVWRISRASGREYNS